MKSISKEPSIGHPRFSELQHPWRLPYHHKYEVHSPKDCLGSNQVLDWWASFWICFSILVDTMFPMDLQSQEDTLWGGCELQPSYLYISTQTILELADLPSSPTQLSVLSSFLPGMRLRSSWLAGRNNSNIRMALVWSWQISIILSVLELVKSRVSKLVKITTWGINSCFRQIHPTILVLLNANLWMNDN